jgi:hypothetical protein
MSLGLVFDSIELTLPRPPPLCPMFHADDSTKLVVVLHYQPAINQGSPT